MENKNNCCNKKGTNIKKGILYGILPHSFCIAFIVFSIIGATAVTTLLKPLLLNAYFFHLLVLFSFIFATVSAIIYLKRSCGLSIKSVLNNKKYLSTLYASVVGVNLLLFLVIFPWVANSSFSNKNYSVSNQVTRTISVNIPCSGHAPLIMGEIKKDNGVIGVQYVPLYNFVISYDPQKTSLDRILSLEIFRSFRAVEVNGE